MAVFFIGLGAIAAQAQSLLTFDDLHTADYTNTGFTTFPLATYTPALSTYAGLTWSNFYALDAGAYLYGGGGGNSGYGNAVVSPKNVVFNGSGNPAEISSASAFNLDSGYFTAAWNNGLSLEVQGFNGTNLLYDQTYILNRSGPLFINFNFDGITDAYFVSYGGTGNGFDAPGTHFVIDNLTVSPVPEPSALALLGLAGLLGMARKHWRRGSQNPKF